MKKCCLNCAFCEHVKSNFIGEKIFDDILTGKERENARKNDFGFLTENIDNLKNWDEEYNAKIDNLKKGQYNDKVRGGGPAILELLGKLQNNKYALAKNFGMPMRPNIPDSEYLCCWHKLWNFENKIQELPKLNNKTKCVFFYPYNRKEHKSFEGCEEERKEMQNRKDFNITNWLVIGGIIVSIVIFIVQTYVIK